MTYLTLFDLNLKILIYVTTSVQYIPIYTYKVLRNIWNKISIIQNLITTKGSAAGAVPLRHRTSEAYSNHIKYGDGGGGGGVLFYTKSMMSKIYRPSAQQHTQYCTLYLKFNQRLLRWRMN